MIKLILLFVLSTPLAIIAAPTQYVCTVVQELFLDNSGTLTPYKRALEVGNTFVVDRLSGKIIGRPLTNLTARRIEVVTRGNKGRNFEVFSPSVSGIGKAQSGLLVIREWEVGSEKPFVAFDGDIYSGTCK